MPEYKVGTCFPVENRNPLKRVRIARVGLRGSDQQDSKRGSWRERLQQRTEQRLLEEASAQTSARRWAFCSLMWGLLSAGLALTVFLPEVRQNFDSAGWYLQRLELVSLIFIPGLMIAGKSLLRHNTYLATAAVILNAFGFVGVPLSGFCQWDSHSWAGHHHGSLADLAFFNITVLTFGFLFAERMHVSNQSKLKLTT